MATIATGGGQKTDDNSRALNDISFEKDLVMIDMSMIPKPSKGGRRVPVLFLILLCVSLFAFGPSGHCADKALSWSGKWNNKKYKTDGPLYCTMTDAGGGIWKAKFTGTGIRSQFNFDADIKVTRKGNRTTLSGATKVNGDRYQWTGYVNGQTLVGNYRSASGNNGSFSMKQKAGGAK